MVFILFVFSCPLFAVPPPQDPELVRAEGLYNKQSWPDAEKAFLGHAAHSPKDPSAAAALCKAGLCRLNMRDDEGAMKLFEKVAEDPAAAKSAPDAAASAFDQMHLLLLKQAKRPAREKLIARCRKALPGHSVNALISEREGDARLESGVPAKALEFYALAGAGLSATGTNTVRLLSAPKTGISFPPLTSSDADTLASVAAVKPACGFALCDVLAKRKEGWRAEMTRARIFISQKKFAEAVSVWEALLKSGQGPADEIGLTVAETRGFMMGDFTLAVPLYETWLKRFPVSPVKEKAEYQYAGATWMYGDYAAAVTRFEAFLKAYPQSHFADAAKGTLARAQADLAYRLKATALAAETKAENNPLSADLAAAEAKAKDGSYPEALKLFARFRGKQSLALWGRAWYGYGLCRRTLGEPEKALEAWDEVLRQAALFTNTVYAAECRRAKADVWFEDLAKPEKALPEYLAARADARGQGKLPAGSSADSPDPALEQRIAEALLALGRGSEARPVFEAFREKELGDPFRVRHWDGLIALCDKPAAAIDARTPEERKADTLRKVADVHFAAERWEKSQALYLKAAKTAPATEAAAWSGMQRARCLAYLGKPERALAVYDLFKTEHRKSVWADDALLRAGVLCTGPMGDPRKGAAYFREILAAHPDGDQAETAFLYLATVAWWTGEWSAAERLHKAFLAKYPDSPFKEDFLTVRLPAIAAKSSTIARTEHREENR